MIFDCGFKYFKFVKQDFRVVISKASKNFIFYPKYA